MSIKNKFNLFSQKFYFVIFILSLFTITFLSSYYITDYLINPSSRVEDKTGDNDNSDLLSDNILVTLLTGDDIDYSKTLKNIKSDFDLDLKDKISLDALTDFFYNKDSYLLEKASKTALVFKRSENSNSSSYLPNKYYLGEYNGYISLFKTDENGNVITEEIKVYEEYKPINFLPESDQKLIINNNFYYDNREDALMKLSEMVS